MNLITQKKVLRNKIINLVINKIYIFIVQLTMVGRDEKLEAEIYVLARRMRRILMLLVSEIAENWVFILIGLGFVSLFILYQWSIIVFFFFTFWVYRAWQDMFEKIKDITRWEVFAFLFNPMKRTWNYSRSVRRSMSPTSCLCFSDSGNYSVIFFFSYFLMKLRDYQFWYAAAATTFDYSHCCFVFLSNKFVF